jgi:hypothetical protein
MENINHILIVTKPSSLETSLPPEEISNPSLVLSGTGLNIEELVLAEFSCNALIFKSTKEGVSISSTSRRSNPIKLSEDRGPVKPTVPERLWLMDFKGDNSRA